MRHRFGNHTLEMKTFKYKGEQLFIDTTGRYANGAMLVTAHMKNGRLWGILSVNIPLESEMLYPGEFFAKTWTENEGWAEAALKAGIFVDTGVRVSTGFVKAQLWRLA